MREYSYYKNALSGQLMPCAFLDIDALEHNSQQVLRLSGQKLVRIASKSVRSAEVLKRIQVRDARYRGLLCYTAREAIYLGERGFDDLVVAYPVWNSAEIAIVAEAAQNGRSVTLMIDSVEHIEHIASVARDHEVRIPLCIDIDMSSDYPGIHFGVWRSAIRTEEKIRELAARIADSRHVVLDGVMGYEAQIAGLGDRLTGQRLKSALIRWLKRKSVREIRQRRADLVGAILSSGHKLRFVNGGGTGSITSTCSEPAVTEVTVGSAFYSPALFDGYSDFRYEPAAAFAIEIVREPRPELYTCLGGGYVASGVADVSRLPKPWLPEGAKLLPLEGAGEVQTPIEYRGAEKLALGDPVFMRHSKAGELCEHFTHLLLVSHGRVIDKVTTYRGDGQCFL